MPNNNQQPPAPNGSGSQGDPYVKESSSLSGSAATNEVANNATDTFVDYGKYFGGTEED